MGASRPLSQHHRRRFVSFVARLDATQRVDHPFVPETTLAAGGGKKRGKKKGRREKTREAAVSRTEDGAATKKGVPDAWPGGRMGGGNERPTGRESDARSKEKFRGYADTLVKEYFGELFVGDWGA